MTLGFAGWSVYAQNQGLELGTGKEGLPWTESALGSFRELTRSFRTPWSSWRHGIWCVVLAL